LFRDVRTDERQTAFRLAFTQARIRPFLRINNVARSAKADLGYAFPEAIG
jgi:hypothetical protein